MTKALPTLLAALIALATASPALAMDDPAAMAGYWEVAPGAGQPACDLELMPAIAHEFEGVWYVARPLHYEDNRAACRGLGIADVVAWGMPEAGDALWLLAEGDAGFMAFAGGGNDRWTIVRSGHAALPALTLEKLTDLPTE